MHEIVTINNTTFTIRDLFKDDIPEIDRIVESQRTSMKLARNLEINKFAGGLKRNIDRDCLCVGAFDEGNRLRCTYAVHFWPSLPYAVDDSLFVDKSNTRIFNPLKSGLSHILKCVYNYCESHGVYKHYSIRDFKSANIELRQLDKYTKEFSDRYHIYDEVFIEANKEPKWRIYWNVMMQQTYPYDIVIRCSALKNSERKLINGSK